MNVDEAADMPLRCGWAGSTRLRCAALRRVSHVLWKFRCAGLGGLLAGRAHGAMPASYDALYHRSYLLRRIQMALQRGQRTRLT